MKNRCFSIYNPRFTRWQEVCSPAETGFTQNPQTAGRYGSRRQNSHTWQGKRLSSSRFPLIHVTGAAVKKIDFFRQIRDWRPCGVGCLPQVPRRDGELPRRAGVYPSIFRVIRLYGTEVRTGREPHAVPACSGCQNAGPKYIPPRVSAPRPLESGFQPPRRREPGGPRRSPCSEDGRRRSLRPRQPAAWRGLP